MTRANSAWRRVSTDDFAARPYTPRRPFSTDETAAVLYMAQDGRPVREIAMAVGRVQGAIKSIIRRLRRDGLLPSRRR